MRFSVLVPCLSLSLAACGADPLAAKEGGEVGGEVASTDLVGVADPAAVAAPTVAGAPAYRDVEESFDNETDQNRWFELRRRLRQDFDDVCGDTFCEGDFTNLQAMSFRCSASMRTG